MIQALMDPNGEPLWVSDVMPGSTHDLTAARELVLAIAWHYTADMPILADGGYDGAGCGVLTPVPQRTDGIPLHVNAHTYNKLLRGLRCLGERGFAVLTERWKALEHVTISPEGSRRSPEPPSPSHDSSAEMRADPRWDYLTGPNRTATPPAGQRHRPRPLPRRSTRPGRRHPP